MSNNLLTISKITNEALMVLENSLTFTSEVERNYDDQFAVVGAKIGNTLNVRRPGRFIAAMSRRRSSASSTSCAGSRNRATSSSRVVAVRRMS